MAATIGSASSSYNERDQLATVSTSDSAPYNWSETGKTVSKSVSCSYYKDGSKKRTTTGEGQYTEYSYDSRGRVVSVYDSNGGVDSNGNTRIPAGAVTTTTYASDGTQTQEVKNGSTLRYKRVTKPTVGGLTGYTWECVPNECSSNTTTTTTRYSGGGAYVGLPSQVVTRRAVGYDHHRRQL